MADLVWSIANPTTAPCAGLTAYRKERGVEDLFSVYLEFERRTPGIDTWAAARIVALVPEMDSRLPSVGNVLVITAGHHPVAEAIVVLAGQEWVG